MKRIVRRARTAIGLAAEAAEIVKGNLMRKAGSSPKVRICISTTSGYAERTIPPLLEQLAAAGIPRAQLVVIEGGHRETRQAPGPNLHYQVDHNSFDLTSLIAVLDLALESEYWLLLHDTVVVHPAFRILLGGLQPRGLQCMPLRRSPSMNIGLYHHQFLLDQVEYLRSVKNHDYSDAGIQAAKRRAVAEEDFLFNRASTKRVIHPHLARFEKADTGKFHGVTRFRERYPQLGLIKFKANNVLADRYQVTL
jgi:hypothetical protein